MKFINALVVKLVDTKDLKSLVCFKKKNQLIKIILNVKIFA